MNFVYDLVHQMDRRALRLDRKSLNGKRAYKLYLYLSKTKNPSSPGEAAVIGCTEGGAVHRKTLHYLGCALVNNLTALRPGEMTSGKLADTRKYVWKLIAIGRRQVYEPNSALVIPFLKEAFHLAEDNGLVMAAKVSSELLANLLGHRYIDEKEYALYRHKADLYRKLNLEVQRSILCFREVSFLFSRDEQQKRLVELLHRRLKELEAFERETWHPRLSLIVFQLKIKLREIEGDPAGMIFHASDALLFLAAYPKLAKENRVVFITYIGYAYLLLNDFAEGAKLIDELMKEVDPSTINYGKIAEIKLLLCLRTRHYEEALNSFIVFENWLIDNEREADFVQSYSLFSSYVLLLLSLQIIEAPLGTEGKGIDTRGLKSGLELLGQSTDVMDLNHYHVISLIINLNKHRFREARENWRSLRSSKKITGIRFMYFYAMLTIIFEQGLHRMAVERHAQKPLGKLKANLLSSASIFNLRDIVPYEELWQMALEQLQNKRVRLR